MTSAAATTLFGAIGTVAAILAVLVPLLRTQGRRLDRFEERVNARFDAVTAHLSETRTELRADVAAVRADVAEGRRDLHALAERVARIEGALTGPWRPPANGSPAPAPDTPPEAAAG